MAIEWFAGRNKFACLSSDTKPTNVPTNTIAWETNTDNEYRFNGTTWIIFSGPGAFPTLAGTATFSNKTLDQDINTFIRVGGYDAIIYKSGTVYKSKKWDGTLLASSTTLNAVVQAALDVKGLILWPNLGSDYFQPTSGHTGWEVSAQTTLLMSHNTLILPNSTFSGTMFKINDRYGGDHVAYKIVIQGGQITQAGATPSQTWTCFEIESSSSTPGEAGVLNLTLRDVYCKFPGTFIKMKVETGEKSYVNGCNFDSIWCDYPHEGIVMTEGAPSTFGVYRNNFHNVVIQANPGYPDQSQNALIYGMKIMGKANQFYNCKVWDVKSTNACSQIAPTAEDTLIVGGLMTYMPYNWELTQNYGKRTVVIADVAAAHTGYSNYGLLNPFITKTGFFYGTGIPSAPTTTVTGFGLLSSLGTTTGPPVYSETRTTSGLAKKMTTSTTINTMAGIRNGAPSTYRYFEPMMLTRFKLGTTTNQRIFVGYASSTSVTIGTADDPLVSLNGFGLYHSTTHGTSATNWLVAQNNGAASSTFTNTGIAANNTNMCTTYVAGWEDEEVAWQWRINSVVGQHGKITTGNLPAQLTGLAPGIFMSNTAAEDKSVEVFMMTLKNNRSEIS